MLPMMSNSPSSNVIRAEQDKLLQEIKKNDAHCKQVEGSLKSIVSAVVNARQSTSTANSKPLTSVEVINNTKEVDEDAGVNNMLKLISEGEVNISDEVMKHLQDLTARIDVINEVAHSLQDRWSALESVTKMLEKQLNDTNQYLKYDNLALHKFPLPSRHLSSLEFSHYIADLINKIVPNLPLTVSWQHISDAHPLRTKSKKSNVIIVRFCNRNVRHAIYDQRDNLPKGMGITEHLTENNLNILKEAKKLFGHRNAWTEKGTTVINFNDETRKAYSTDDVNRLHELQKVHLKNTTNPNSPKGHSHTNFNNSYHSNTQNRSYNSNNYMNYTNNFAPYNNYHQPYYYRQPYYQPYFHHDHLHRTKQRYGGMNFRNAVVSH